MLTAVQLEAPYLLISDGVPHVEGIVLEAILGLNALLVLLIL